MSFFRRLFGMETPNEKLQRQLQNERNNILKILRKDNRIDDILLKKLENGLFTPEEILKTINELLEKDTVEESTVNDLQEAKKDIKEILIEEAETNKTANVDVVEEAVVSEVVPQTNAELLSDINTNLIDMVSELATNNKSIANMELQLKGLRAKTADINLVIDELREQMDNTDDDEEKKRLLDQIIELEEHKKAIDASASNIKQQIIGVQKLVKDQSKHLASFHNGSGKRQRQSPIAKINKMTRKDLDKAAKSLNLTPSNFRSKKDIQDAVKLVTLIKQLPIQKLDKTRLAIISRNYGIPTKTKKGMLEGLKKYKVIR